LDISLGIYTQLSDDTSAPVFQRALSCVLKPALTYAHNTDGISLSLVLTPAMIRYLRDSSPEINLLVSGLVKKGKAEAVTMPYGHSILSLLPQKDRGPAVDKTTTLIRKTYGRRASSVWLYGQIWTPSLIQALKGIALERVIISSYNANLKKCVYTEPFTMSEIGKSFDVIPFSDVASKLVSSYSQNEIGINELFSGIKECIASYDGDGTLLIVLSIDQLLEGASFKREDDIRLKDIFQVIKESADQKGISFVLPKDITPHRQGYLTGGWYGRDSYSGKLSDFNELFSRNENYRYLLNRALSIKELVASFKKGSAAKKVLSDKTLSLPSGRLFLCDSSASALKMEAHRSFYRAVLETEDMLKGQDVRQNLADLDGDGLDEVFCYGRINSAVFAPRGGSVYEFNLMEKCVNILDTVSSWDRDCKPEKKMRSFTDAIERDGKTISFEDEPYDLEAFNRPRTEFSFSSPEKDGVAITKHYRLTNQNLYLNITIMNMSDEMDLKGKYVSKVCLSAPGMSAFAYDGKRDLLVGNSLKGIKTVMFHSHGIDSFALSFSSSIPFLLEEKPHHQGEMSISGMESHYLYTELDFTFDLDVKKKNALVITLVMRASTGKEKE